MTRLVLVVVVLMVAGCGGTDPATADATCSGATLVDESPAVPTSFISEAIPAMRTCCWDETDGTRSVVVFVLGADGVYRAMTAPNVQPGHC